MNRRNALLALGSLFASSASSLQAQQRKRLTIGHTGITWGFKPEDAPNAIRDVAALGYHGYESFGSVLEAWEPKGGLRVILNEHKLPLVSAYCDVNLTEPSKRADEIAKITRWAKLIRQNGGNTAVIGPNGVRRAAFDFKQSKDNIVSALNDICKAATDAGVTPALHPHAGTCIESRDEVYAVLESADTKFVKFGPDVGQFAKSGVDPVKVVKDFLPIIHHFHLKDWDGGPHWDQYCPVGKGKVDSAALLDLAEKAEHLKMVMIELDPGRNPPMSPGDTAKAAREYLIGRGYQFRPTA